VCKIWQGTVDVPAATSRVIVVREYVLESGDEGRLGNACSIGDVVAATKDPVNACIRRKEPTPPGEVEVLKAFDGEDAEVDFGSIGKADGNELGEEGIEIWSSFENGFVEVGTLFAGKAAEGYEKGTVLLAGFSHCFEQVRSPGDSPVLGRG
jgi:hypothetical protein